MSQTSFSLISIYEGKIFEQSAQEFEIHVQYHE